MICGWIKIIVAKSQQTNIHADLTGPTCVQTGSESDSGMNNERRDFGFCAGALKMRLPPQTRREPGGSPAFLSRAGRRLQRQLLMQQMAQLH